MFKNHEVERLCFSEILGKIKTILLFSRKILPIRRGVKRNYLELCLLGNVGFTTGLLDAFCDEADVVEFGKFPNCIIGLAFSAKIEKV